MKDKPMIRLLHLDLGGPRDGELHVPSGQARKPEISDIAWIPEKSRKGKKSKGRRG